MLIERTSHWLRSRITNLEVELDGMKEAAMVWERRARDLQRDNVKLKKRIEELEDDAR